MVTTVDLLLTLGSKLADVLILVLNKRLNKKDKQDAQQLVDQYNQLKQAHLQISAVVKAYNESISKALVTGNLQSLYQLCTQHIKEMDFSSQDITRSFLNAQVYTDEKWITIFSSGAKNESEVINHYWLSQEAGAWKIAGAEVFVKA